MHLEHFKNILKPRYLKAITNSLDVSIKTFIESNKKKFK